jgi:hypothetical protein
MCKLFFTNPFAETASLHHWSYVQIMCESQAPIAQQFIAQKPVSELSLRQTIKISQRLVPPYIKPLYTVKNFKAEPAYRQAGTAPL